MRLGLVQTGNFRRLKQRIPETMQYRTEVATNH